MVEVFLIKLPRSVLLIWPATPQQAVSSATRHSSWTPASVRHVHTRIQIVSAVHPIHYPSVQNARLDITYSMEYVPNVQEIAVVVSVQALATNATIHSI